MRSRCRSRRTASATPAHMLASSANPRRNRRGSNERSTRPLELIRMALNTRRLGGCQWIARRRTRTIPDRGRASPTRQAIPQLARGSRSGYCSASSPAPVEARGRRREARARGLRAPPNCSTATHPVLPASSRRRQTQHRRTECLCQGRAGAGRSVRDQSLACAKCPRSFRTRRALDRSTRSRAGRSSLAAAIRHSGRCRDPPIWRADKSRGDIEDFGNESQSVH
jgi:hypothetical protein